MNNVRMGLTAPRLWWLRRIAISAVVAGGLAVLTAGCGGKSGAPAVASVKTNASTTQSQPKPAEIPLSAELSASRCMRTHGVPNFPDPITIGGQKYFGFYANSGISTTSPAYKAAYKYCVGRYMPSFKDVRTPAEKAESNAEALKYSQCMRSHGVSNFPEPDGTGAIYLPTANYFDAPKPARAQSSCKPLFTGKFVFVFPFH